MQTDHAAATIGPPVRSGILTDCPVGAGRRLRLFHTDAQTWMIDSDGYAKLVQSSVRDILGPYHADGRTDVAADLVPARGGDLVVRS